jgi:peptidoglycan L-alanyl-D-glutamate endopeptidase CwlK
MTFKIGARSAKRLEGVHPDLVAVVRRAIEYTTVDFTVIQGLRTPAEQKKLVSAGASQTMDSRHLTGHAVDLGAWVGGKVRWDWPLYYPIARAMQKAATDLNIPVRWGGCWRELAGMGDPEDAVADYVALRRSQKRPAFTDGPHFELPRRAYP